MKLRKKSIIKKLNGVIKVEDLIKSKNLSPRLNGLLFSPYSHQIADANRLKTLDEIKRDKNEVIGQLTQSGYLANYTCSYDQNLFGSRDGWP